MGTYLLTGATSGIGRDLAQRLLERGEELVLVVRDEARAADLPGAQVVVADLADPGSWGDLALPDRLDGLVHSAGVAELGLVTELSTASWQSQLSVNLVAPAELTRRALPALRAAAGTVVFVNSGSGLRTNATWAAYSASKFGLRALADAVRAEEPEIRVTSIYPGRVATPMQERIHEQEGRAYDDSDWIQPATVATAIIDALDLTGDATVPDLTLRPVPRG